MATVYERIQEYKKTSQFNFHPSGINLIGKFIARKWRQKGYKMDTLDVVQSIEGEGVAFMVYSYPGHFIPDMDELIDRFVQWCIAPKPLKITEKPVPEKPSEPQKRKRKPIQKPFFSGRQLKK